MKKVTNFFQFNKSNFVLISYNDISFNVMYIYMYLNMNHDVMKKK